MDKFLFFVGGFVLGDAVGIAGIINIWNKVVALFQGC